MYFYLLFLSFHSMPSTQTSPKPVAQKPNPDPLITNMKQESLTPPRFPFSGTPDYLKNPPVTEPRRNPPRESSKKQPPFNLCPKNNVTTCHCEGLKIVIPPPSPDIPPCPKNLREQFKHWDLSPKK